MLILAHRGRMGDLQAFSHESSLRTVFSCPTQGSPGCTPSPQAQVGTHPLTHAAGNPDAVNVTEEVDVNVMLAIRCKSMIRSYIINTGS